MLSALYYSLKSKRLSEAAQLIHLWSEALGQMRTAGVGMGLLESVLGSWLAPPV